MIKHNRRNKNKNARLKQTALLALLIISLPVYLISLAAKPVKEASVASSQIHQYGEIPQAPDANPESFTVMTYNIGYASGDKNNKGSLLTREEVLKNLDSLAEAIRSQNPDVVGMQEVDFNSARTFGINQMDYLAKKTGLPFAASALTWSKRYVPWPYWPPQVHFGRVVSGQAVLSRYPILNQDLLTFEKPQENAFWYNWFYLDRIVQKISLRTPSGDFNLWHGHIEAFHHKTRLAQARIWAEKVRELQETKTLVFGDINSVSKIKEGLSPQERGYLEDSGEALQALISIPGLQNAETPDTGLTMPSWEPVKKIDHILHSSDLEVVEVQTLEGITASDHLPVTAEFRARPQ